MARWVVRLAALGAIVASACVDGTTPDCSTPETGCYPGEGGTNPGDSSASDASSDASGDASSDAANDAATD